MSYDVIAHARYRTSSGLKRGQLNIGTKEKQARQSEIAMLFSFLMEIMQILMHF